MAFFSGNGGGILVGAGSEMSVVRWEINHRARLAENTHSGTNGASNYELVVEDNDATIEIPLDTENWPEVDMGLAAGSKLTLTGNLGATAKTCVLTNTTVETVTYINANDNDIGRARVTTKGGKFTGPAT